MASLLTLWIVWVLPFSATDIPVKHKEGTSHGFIVLRSQEGQTLATGDMIQTVDGEQVTSQVLLHFNDGSIHDEVAVFSQKTVFRLLTDHLRQYGPSFPIPIDIYIDARSGIVKVHVMAKIRTTSTICKSQKTLPMA